MDDCRTIVIADLGPTPFEASEELLARAVRAMPHLPAHEEVAYRLFWSDEDGALAFADLGRDEHLVIGRHPQAHVRLWHPCVALRHVLVRVRPTEHGPTLVLEDLGTADGFRVGPTARPSRGVLAYGSTVLSLRRHVVVALAVHASPDPMQAAPSEGAPIGAAPIEAALAVEQSALVPKVIDARTMVSPEPSAPLHSSNPYTTIVREVSEPVPVEHLPRCENPWARLRLRGPGGHVVFEVSRADLERPLLVGRYDRCRRGALAPFSPSVSRVHAGVVCDGEGVRVLDLASSNGLAATARSGAEMWVQAIRVRRAATILLAGDNDFLDIEILGA